MSIPEIHSILDGTEVFIETPINLDLLKITWSDYKYHKYSKTIVLCSTPNSSVIFVSKAYGGSISCKNLQIVVNI